jgi:CelD/BcsL family acetyltransferase involved in cellulose biosynthesis
MNLELLPRAPTDWPQKARWPIQQVPFAEALRAMGYEPFYATEGSAAALVQLRGTWPLLGRLLGRAYVYVSNETPQFVNSLLTLLRQRHVPFVRFGNTMWGIQAPAAFAAQPSALEEKFTFVLDTTLSEAALWGALDSTIRRAIRAAQKNDVTVREATTAQDVERCFPVFEATGERILKRNPFSAPPLDFFHAIFNGMVPAGQAVYYMAEYQGRCIGVILNFVYDDTMLYYAGGSLRDFSKQNAPSLMHWHAVQQCRARGLRRYDLGGCSPNLPETDPRYGVFHYKQKWGGTLEKFYNAELYLSPGVRSLQTFLRDRVWRHAQKLYFAGKRA